jgi:hypothetical protein
MNIFTTKKQLFLIIALCAQHISFANISRDLDLDILFNSINHTQTHTGKKTLRTLLAQPTNNLPALQSRQAVIGYIADQPTLHTELHAALQQFHRYELCFQSMTQQSSIIEKAALSEFYFSSSYFKQWNYSPIGLELGQIAHFGNLCSSLVQHALAFAIFTWGLEEEHTCAVHPGKKHDHKHKHKKHNHDHKHDHSSCAHEHPSKSIIKALVKSSGFKQAFQMWHGIAQIQELYGIQSVIRNNLYCIKKIQTNMIGLASGIRTIKNIHELLENHSEITSHITRYKDLENLFEQNELSPKLNALLELLEQPTFTGKPSTFSRIGNILAAYKLARECAHELQPALDAIGEIDAYTSCAQLFTGNQHSPLRYSFAQYITNATKPSLNAVNFWHPLMTNTKTQLNSIDLGYNNNTHNILLTGPNACGKSTNLKTITLCAYLAQTITLVPAQEYSQTLYKEIYSSIVVSDDIENNLSLFATELTNAEQLLGKVEALGENEFMFIALDELFTSTHHEKGQRVALNLLRHLYACPQLTTVISTHFEQLVELADNSFCRCTNYTVNNFVLSPGIGSPNDSFDIINKKITSRLLQ